jgi:hypothetical protein
VSIDSAFNYGYVHEIKMIKDHHILMRNSKGLILLKLNYESWEATVVSIDRRYVDFLLVDELDKRQCLIGDRDEFSVDTLIEDEFVIGAKKAFDLDGLQWPKLSGDKLVGFRRGIFIRSV